jgi:hypothetical protein
MLEQHVSSWLPDLTVQRLELLNVSRADLEQLIRIIMKREHIYLDETSKLRLQNRLVKFGVWRNWFHMLCCH